MVTGPDAPAGRQRGHVLWLVLVMLSVLAELATGSLQMAAAGGLMAVREAGHLAGHARAEAVASALQRLPLPVSEAASVAAGTADAPWLAATGAGADTRGCGIAGKPYAATGCDAGAQGWSWRLRLISDQSAGEGTDTVAFPQLRAQRWRLEVAVGAGTGTGAVWRFDYLQRVRP